jgi:multidrug efflux pump subunit AcrB
VIARFFVDRPVFSTVISVVITLAGLVAVFTLPVAQYPEVTPPTVQVTALYPGANALTVRDTVAAPIEEQVSGVEGMMYMSSRCTNDGTYNLTVTFKLGMDSDMAQVLVQNRVSLALPVIPPLVQNEGITVKKMSPNTLMIVNLISPDGRYNNLYLSNYASINVRDELGRLKGVAAVGYIGQRDYSLRAWLDPDKLAALNLSAMDVVTAISQQNIQVAAGQIGQQPVPRGQQFQLTVNTQGRLTDPEQFADIILKGGGQSNSLLAAQGTNSGQGSTTTTGGQSGTSGSTDSQDTPTMQATGIVRLRDVVRQNRFYFRLRFDAAKLAEHNLQSSDVVNELRTGPRFTITDDPDSPPVEGEGLTWVAVLGGIQAPREQVVADTTLAFGSEAPVRLGDLVRRDGGIEHLEARDEPGVERGAQQYDQSCTLDGRPSVALSIYQLPGSNALETAGGVYAKMKELKARFPDGLDYKIVYDTTPFIRESVNEVFYTLRDAVILVAIVVLVFLQDWRAMILPMIDVPVSLIGTFAVMALMGFSLNNLTLFGLVLAIGIVVDDAIVVLENIERLIATGLDARTATIKAMEEITGPVLAITLVLSSVFIPCCFLGGISGQFFRQFAVTIAVSTIISAINALTMTPSRAVLIFKTEEGEGRSGEPSRTEAPGAARHDGGAARLAAPTHKREALPWWIFGVLGGVLTVWLGPALLASYVNLPPGWGPAPEGEAVDMPAWLSWAVTGAYFLPGAVAGGLLGWLIIRPVNAVLGWFFRAFNVYFDRMTGFYGAVVGKVLRLGVVVLLVYGGLLALTYWEFVRTPTGFIPQQDKGYLIVNVQLPDSASAERTQGVMAQLDRLIMGDPRDRQHSPRMPGVSHTVGISGQSLILGANAPNLGSMYVLLEDFDKRRGGALTADAIARQIEDRCHEQVAEALVSVFGAPPVDGLGTTGGFNLIVEDRGSLGLEELERVGNDIVKRGKKAPAVTGMFNSSGASTPWLYLDIDRSKCLALGVPVSDVFNTLQVYLGSYYVNNFNEFGRTWQVNVQADPRFRSRASDIRQLQVRNNQGQMVRLGTLLHVRDTTGPVMVMRYNMYAAASITGNAAPGTGSQQAVDVMQQLGERKLPQSMKLEWTGLAYLQNQAGTTAMWFFVLAVVFVFLVLAAQYESWKLPLAVILVVPMCLLCSVVGVQLAGLEVTIFTQIGFVVLVGLASKNAILIVEFAKQQEEAGVARRQAIVQACKLRLRPILMTSFAFILGVVPLVLAEGAGAEMRRSLGTAVFAGMLGVTAFGIFLTPVFYDFIQWLGGEKKEGAVHFRKGPALAGVPEGAFTATPPEGEGGEDGDIPEVLPAPARRYSPAARPERERGSRRRRPAAPTEITPGADPARKRPKGPMRWG